MSQLDSDVKKPLVLVIGSNGQLAYAIRSLNETWSSNFQLIFAGSKELDIREESHVRHFVEIHQPSIIINCAAYTNVDRAEDEPEEAMRLNAIAAGHLAEAANAIDAAVVHISTDYVFDGLTECPYRENDNTNPKSNYGESKLRGEIMVRENNTRHYIIRTSWLYGNHGHNFLNTMLRLAEERRELSVVTDQIASPTWVMDLAKGIHDLLMKVWIDKADIPYGVWHFSNLGEASWCNFSEAIFSLAEKEIGVIPANGKTFPTKAFRPQYSKLNCDKWEAHIGTLSHWKVSLLRCLHERRLQMGG